MARNKRKRTGSVSNASVDDSLVPAKKTRESTGVDHDDDDLAEVLEQIRQLEESERLARELQHAFESQDAAPAPIPRNESGGASSSQQDVICIDSDDDVLVLSEAPALQGKGSSKATISTGGARNGRAAGSSKTAATYSSPDEQLSGFRTKASSQSHCPRCNKTMKPLRRLIVFTESIPPTGLRGALHLSCPGCKEIFCRGCLSAVSCAPSCKGKSNQSCVVDECCKAVRALAIFEAFGALDRGYQGEKSRNAVQSASHATGNGRGRGRGKARGGTATSNSVGPGGTGYSIGRGHVSQASSSKALEAASSMAADWDYVVTNALRTITHYLPKPYSEEAQGYDFVPDESLPALLALSCLPELLTDLLRNDSVTDWIARAPVYEAMLGLLRRLCDCELTLSFLTGRLCAKKESCGIQNWAWGEGEISWQTEADGKTIARDPPLYAYFTKLVKQADAFLAGAQTLMDSDDDAGIESAIKATSLCGDIAAARDDIERALQTLGHSLEDTEPASFKGKGKGKAKATEAEVMEREYAKFCESLAFEHVSFIDGPKYNYQPSLKQTGGSTRNPKDRLHMLQELAVMATSLPPGIWVRVDDVRNDAIKIMIAGPEGTPYESGLFEFDCFMPLRYPHEPPQMHLRTTGNGTVRFNPNLYNNGKVCLSLLGTWQGGPEEQWRPGKSTLLQVLVSIQSMIFVDLPYFNEPGHGHAKHSPASTAYNKNIWLQTVRWAMVNWMRDVNKQGLWADVIAGHFKIRRKAIRQT
ncbi:hypothetical protein AURDEDRAFT_181457 [Auricularia subglabra TFB-10046 SS5]|nr:hypothetical protein AURDEDRAFT_181457 [Auricularia subglabra TFB-10046 SS5]